MKSLNKVKPKITIDQLQKQLDQLKTKDGNTKKTSPRSYLWAFYILLILFIGLGAYTGFFIYKSRQQVAKLSNDNSKLTAEKKSLEDLVGRQGGDLSNRIKEIIQLKADLDEKPTTVYVPQAPVYTPPKSTNTNCYPTFSGGFNCYTF